MSRSRSRSRSKSSMMDDIDMKLNPATILAGIAIVLSMYVVYQCVQRKRMMMKARKQREMYAAAAGGGTKAKPAPRPGK